MKFQNCSDLPGTTAALPRRAGAHKGPRAEGQRGKPQVFGGLSTMDVGQGLNQKEIMGHTVNDEEMYC